MHTDQKQPVRRLLLRWAPPLLLLLVFCVFVVRINAVDKFGLVSREGQTFEKGVVTEIIQDNLQYDGSRVGEQVVRVQMKTGARAGQTLEMTSSSGYLFGAGCTVGMKVIVMQSVSGDSTVASVYAQTAKPLSMYLRGCTCWCCVLLAASRV